MVEFKTTRDKILEAAGEDPSSKKTLKVLFPEAFSDEVDIVFQVGDHLIQKGSNKVYLIAVDEEKYLRIVGVTSGYIWTNKFNKIIDSRNIEAQQVRQVFGLRNLKEYTLNRKGQVINL